MSRAQESQEYSLQLPSPDPIHDPLPAKGPPKLEENTPQ